ncbi:MAG: serine/threonine protein kinase [Oligoflexia bacterium]|nr:serine/threonine protein kinase [Oligoflexia bacterium]
MADLKSGTQLGDRFVINGVLGRGGMATVYLAQDQSTGKRVALKLLHPHLVTDPSARRRLAREIQAAGRLDHPGVLVAQELVELDGQIGLVLPLHLGRTLAETVAMDGPLPPDQVRRVGIRLAEALGAAHRAGVLHRDLTARNVLIDDHGAPVLTDFGLARLANQGTAHSTALLGTAGFVAPEIMAGERADPRSDLYGLGAVLYQAATGHEPFGGGHPQAALQAQLSGEFTPITETVPDFPPWLEQTITALLNPNPAKRPQGAAAVVSALEEGRAPEPPPQTGPLQQVVTARLPAGNWTVAVGQGATGARAKGSRARRRARRRALRHGKGDLGRLMRQVSHVVDQVTGVAGQPATEERLTAAIASQAGLPEGALKPSPALDLDAYRLVAHVDRDTAEALANQARIQGLKATIYPEREPDDLQGWLLAHWHVAIPLMWIAFPALLELGAPEYIVFVFVAMTVGLATLLGPWVSRNMLPTKVKQLPIAYTNDLAAQLTQGLAASAAPGTAAGQAQTTEPPDTERSRSQLLTAQARASLEDLDSAIQSHTEDLPSIVASDLRSSVRDLHHEVDELTDDAQRLEAALTAATPAAVADNGGWAAERLARLQTLAAAGQSVDQAEHEHLAAAVAAHQAATEAEQALDSQLTATQARLLEISATARRLAKELELNQTQTRQPARALDDLRSRAAAAAKARQELAAART